MNNVIERLDLWTKDFEILAEKGLSKEDEHAIILALWCFARGTPLEENSLSLLARLLYTEMKGKILGKLQSRTVRQQSGKKGGIATQAKLRQMKRQDISNEIRAPAQPISQAPLEQDAQAPLEQNVQALLETTVQAPCSTTATPTATATSTAAATSTTTSPSSFINPIPMSKCIRPHFVPPTLSEIKNFCGTEEISIDPEKFLAYYESVGWKVGKKPMKDWKASIRYWAKNDLPATPRRPTQNTSRNTTFTQANYKLLD